MDISVIVPVYNPPHHLFEANIKSLTSQCGDFEFIYINDGSTDKWITDRLQCLARTDSRIVYVNKQNSAQVRKSVDSPPGMLTEDHHHTVHEERQVCYSSHLRPKPLHL